MAANQDPDEREPQLTIIMEAINKPIIKHNKETSKFEDKEPQSPHLGIPLLKDYQRLQDINNREINTFMPPDLVIKSMYEMPKHPYLRPLIGIHTDGFKTGIKVLTDEVLKAKRDKHGVFHIHCCNIVWIGKKPICHNHVMNDLLKKMLNRRNVPKSLYNPEYLPPSPILMEFTDIIEEQQPETSVITEELIKQDETWSNIFGPSYNKKFTEKQIMEHRAMQDQSDSTADQQSQESFEQQSAAPGLLKTKQFYVEHPRIYDELRYFSQGYEVGKNKIMLINDQGQEAYMTDDEDSTEHTTAVTPHNEQEGYLG